MARPSDIIVVGAGVVGCAVASELARRGASVEIVDERPVAMGATQASAGLLIEPHGFVAAGDLTRALAAAARRAGAQVIEASRVRRIARRDGDTVVETDRGSLTGSAVVVAAGSWSGDIRIDGVTARVPVRPVRGQLLALAWNGTPLRRVTWSGRCYLVPWD